MLSYSSYFRTLYKYSPNAEQLLDKSISVGLRLIETRLDRLVDQLWIKNISPASL